MKPVKWGIISTAKIAWEKVIPAMASDPNCDIVAIASRDLKKAKTVAEKLGIPKAYGSYEDLFADPEIEAVYNPLPNNYHLPVSIQAMEAGKHVLCEKPIAMDASEVEQLIAARDRTGMQIVEAFMVRHHPQWKYVREMVKSGDIGDIQTIQSVFSFNLIDKEGENIRNQASKGGGGVYDIGVYATVVSRYIFGFEPKRVMALTRMDPKFEVDRLASVILDFDGKHASFVCSTQMVPYQRVNVFGSKKRIEIEIPFNAPLDESMRIFTDDGTQLGSRAAQEHKFEVADQYRLQGEAFNRYVRGEEIPEHPLEDALKNMKVIDAIFQSADEDIWVDL